jgi:hypothetical protein
MRFPMLQAGLCLAGGLLLATPRPAAAERVRFHFVPAAQGPATTLQPAGTGERVSWFGTVREPYNSPQRPTHVVTFRHAYSGQLVSVPMTLPEGTPRIEYRANRIIYNYGSYTVQAVFLQDGSVDVVYDSGFLRPL